jgi:integrase
MGKPKFPMIVKRGHTIVKIYKTPSNDSDQFTVSYYLGRDRKRKTFADLGLAITEAETTASMLSQGELNVLELRNEDRLSYARAVEALKPLGVPLEMAVMQFVEAVKVLEGASLVEAARYYAKHQPHKMPKKTVGEVIDELILAKEADRLSTVYLKDLRGRLKRFREKFSGNIGLISISEIDAFLRDLKSEEKADNGKIVTRTMSAKSRNNYRAAIGTLFYFAEARAYIQKASVDIESIALAREKGTDIEIFRPEEMERILAAVEKKPDFVPFLAIGAFAGLRTAEIQRLDWSEVRLDDGLIEVKASKAKTASRRLVPITPNLKAWLKPHKKATGPVCEYVTLSHQLDWLTEAVNEAWEKENEPGKFEWKHNALRHSFISYRVADIQNVAQVALEAGNSPRMVFSNYRELVRPADAKKWFGITPATVAAAKAEWEKNSKIIALLKAKAA